MKFVVLLRTTQRHNMVYTQRDWTTPLQGSHGHGKRGKIMEFKNRFFQHWKSPWNILNPKYVWKSHGIFVSFKVILMYTPRFHKKRLLMEMWFKSHGKVMERSWKGHGNPLVNMCMNPALFAVPKINETLLQKNRCRFFGAEYCAKVPMTKTTHRGEKKMLTCEFNSPKGPPPPAPARCEITYIFLEFYVVCWRLSWTCRWVKNYLFASFNFDMTLMAH